MGNNGYFKCENCGYEVKALDKSTLNEMPPLRRQNEKNMKGHFTKKIRNSTTKGLF